MIGGIVAWQSVYYGLGSASQMGSGFFPFVLGLLLMFFSIMLFLFDRSCNATDLDRPILKATVLTMLGYMVIAWSIDVVGMAVALVIAVPLFCRAGCQNSTKSVVTVTASALLLCYVIFIWLLDIRLSFW